MMLTDGLFSDKDLAGIMGPEAQISAMLRVEAALARVQGQLGIIPEDAAHRINDAASTLSVAPGDLIAATARSGIAAQAVVGALKAATPEMANWVHFGATSQDIQDSGLVLQLRKALALIEERLVVLDNALAEKAVEFAGQPIAARTRFQIAAPTTLGAKIAVWRAPLSRHIDRLSELRPRLLNLSLFGAAGTGAALAPRTSDIRAALAHELNLRAPDIPWHATRDAIVELGGLLALITGSLGKMGADLILLTQSEVAEVSVGTGGGSSTMPQKSNPVTAEALVTVARLNAGAVGTLHQAMVHAQERDGSALAIEWQTLPDMVVRSGAALRLALGLSETIVPRPERIAATLTADRGAMMAEAASFHLARQMPRDQALGIVAEALQAVAANPKLTLAKALEQRVPGQDWTHMLAPEKNTGDAEELARK